jgi:hypothetical protein
MNTSAQRILHAIQGDTQAITSLAGAIARNDVGAVQEVLAAKGVALTEDEVREVTRGAVGDGGAAFTCTCTCT